MKGLKEATPALLLLGALTAWMATAMLRHPYGAPVLVAECSVQTTTIDEEGFPVLSCDPAHQKSVCRAHTKIYPNEACMK